MFLLVNDIWVEFIFVMGHPVKVWFKNIGHKNVEKEQFDFDYLKEDIFEIVKEMMNSARHSHTRENSFQYHFGKDYIIEVEYLLETREFNPGINWLEAIVFGRLDNNTI